MSGSRKSLTENSELIHFSQRSLRFAGSECDTEEPEAKQGIAKLKENVSSNPNNFGFSVWDGSSLSKHIKDTFDVELGVRACQKLFHKMGFALIRPQTYPSPENPDDEARDAFKKNSAN